jgi:hypothetical protein
MKEKREKNATEKEKRRRMHLFADRHLSFHFLLE